MAVSQAPAVSEASTGVTPAAGGTPLSALPSAVQDLARFFLNLSGSSSQERCCRRGCIDCRVWGPVVHFDFCRWCSRTWCSRTWCCDCDSAGAGDLPAAPTAVPGASGQQQRQEDSCSHRRRRRLSSDRRSKKRHRRRSSSPVPSSRRRERHYRASSSSSEEDRADASRPGAGRAPGGTPGDSRSSRAYNRSPRPGTSRSFVRGERYRTGAGRRSPAPSRAADDDRSSAFESVDFDRDDSFRSVLGLIRSSHGMEEPAGVPSARCKTSLASTYGLCRRFLRHLPCLPLPWYDRSWTTLI